MAPPMASLVLLPPLLQWKKGFSNQNLLSSEQEAPKALLECSARSVQCMLYNYIDSTVTVRNCL